MANHTFCIIVNNKILTEIQLTDEMESDHDKSMGPTPWLLVLLVADRLWGCLLHLWRRLAHLRLEEIVERGWYLVNEYRVRVLVVVYFNCSPYHRAQSLLVCNCTRIPFHFFFLIKSSPLHSYLECAITACFLTCLRQILISQKIARFSDRIMTHERLRALSARTNIELCASEVENNFRTLELHCDSKPSSKFYSLWLGAMFLTLSA